MAESDEPTRELEWYVPKFGPKWFRVVVGLSFYPYTLMNVSYVIIGSLLSPLSVHWDRLAAMSAVYILAVGLSAHSLDAMSPNKPWGSFLSRRFLLVIAISSLAPALVLGGYIAARFAPLLFPIGILEVFFLFAYNMELFGGLLHTDLWFAISWGMLPAIAGYVSQTNTLTLVGLGAGLFGAATAIAEINGSRPYKSLRKMGASAPPETVKLENVLKGLVASLLLLALVLVVYRASP